MKIASQELANNRELVQNMRNKLKSINAYEKYRSITEDASELMGLASMSI